MFINNLHDLEIFGQTKQEEIMREIQGIRESPVGSKAKYKAWVLVSVLTVLAWLFSVII